MIHWMAATVSSLNYLGVALLMAIENVVLPLPSELIMPLAGAQTGHGRMTVLGVVLAGAIGSVVGAYPVYAIGLIFGRDRVMDWVDRHGKWLLLRRGDLEKAGDRFEHRGGAAVFLSQLLPGLRGLIAIPAGFAHMNILWFTIANFAGTFIWCLVLALLGRELGAHFTTIDKYLGPAGWAVFAIVVAGGVTWLYRRKHARGR
jgi:membrane protein DedA with SNARE-associated domain